MCSTHQCTVGDVAPDFKLPDVNGGHRSLADYRGKKVMLSFHRCAACPFSNLAIGELKGRHRKLAWAAKLSVIKIFPSPTCDIETYVVGENKCEYPFDLLADPAEEIYKTYNVGSIPLGGDAGNVRARKKIAADLRAVAEFLRQLPKAVHTGCPRQLPADFLINEDGQIVDFFRAQNIDEHIPLDRVDLFLMGKAAS